MMAARQEDGANGNDEPLWGKTYLWNGKQIGQFSYHFEEIAKIEKVEKEKEPTADGNSSVEDIDEDSEEEKEEWTKGSYISIQ